MSQRNPVVISQPAQPDTGATGEPSQANTRSTSRTRVVKLICGSFFAVAIISASVAFLPSVLFPQAGASSLGLCSSDVVDESESEYVAVVPTGPCEDAPEAPAADDAAAQ
jgi:hypothetical protein